jgi:hypothetical protein
MWRFGLDSTGSEQGYVAGSGKDDGKHPDPKQALSWPAERLSAAQAGLYEITSDLSPKCRSVVVSAVVVVEVVVVVVVAVVV